MPLWGEGMKKGFEGKTQSDKTFGRMRDTQAYSWLFSCAPPVSFSTDQFVTIRVLYTQHWVHSRKLCEYPPYKAHDHLQMSPHTLSSGMPLIQRTDTWTLYTPCSLLGYLGYVYMHRSYVFFLKPPKRRILTSNLTARDYYHFIIKTSH